MKPNVNINTGKGWIIPHILFVLAALLAILVPSVLIFSKGIEKLKDLGLDGWGDFLAGAFGPAALLVLAASFILQQEELRLQRNEMQLTRLTLADQRQELEHSAKEAKKMNEILGIQARTSEWQLMRDDAGYSINTIMKIFRRRFFLSDDLHTVENEDAAAFLVRKTLHEGNFFSNLDGVSGEDDVVKATNEARIYVDRLKEFFQKAPIAGPLSRYFFSKTPEAQIYIIFCDWLKIDSSFMLEQKAENAKDH